MVAVQWTANATRGDYCAMRAPSSENSFSHHLVDNRCARPTPLRKSFCFAIYCYANIASLVVDLLGVRRPANVPRFVVPVCVNAINRVFRRWPHSNFGYELLEGCKAKFNASTSVKIVCFLVGVFASFFSSGVGFVFAGLQHSVLCARFFVKLGRKATTASRVTCLEVSSGAVCYLAACTSTMPTRFPACPSAVSNYLKSPKLKPSQILEVFAFWMGCKNDIATAKILFSHDNSSKLDWSESHAGSSLRGFRHYIASC